MKTAKLLINDDDQAIILPQEFHFQDNEVYIKKIGNVLILIPKANPW
ncbi:MAG: AbrB family transcriptional regulator [Coleofasciculus sp. D1-CHI-01]